MLKREREKEKTMQKREGGKRDIYTLEEMELERLIDSAIMAPLL